MNGYKLLMLYYIFDVLNGMNRLYRQDDSSTCGYFYKNLHINLINYK